MALKTEMLTHEADGLAMVSHFYVTGAKTAPQSGVLVFLEAFGLGVLCGRFTSDPEVICRKPSENCTFGLIQVASHFCLRSCHLRKVPAFRDLSRTVWGHILSHQDRKSGQNWIAGFAASSDPNWRAAGADACCHGSRFVRWRSASSKRAIGERLWERRP